jgi:hypothetical protein
MHASTVGQASIPAPVRLDVTDADVAHMWKAVQKKRYGVASPLLLVVGLVNLLTDLVGYAKSGHVSWLGVAVGIAFTAAAFIRSGSSPKTLRPTELRFADAGLNVDVAFEPPAERAYPWSSIRRFDDVGDAYVLIPKRGKRIVLPKRAFPDRGREACDFVAAHGVLARG